ncbi:7364_t:CDS:10 [Entrophospora sp. SA101]|nr:7364_t:CDS:10 [Entrophospora sp. SA101]
MHEGDQFESYEFDEDEGFVNDEELPNFLYQKWTKLETPNKTLGRIEYKLVLEDDDANIDVPKQYDIENLLGTMDTVQIAGTVSDNRFLRPAFDEDYRRNLRQRTLQASKPKRPIKMIESNENRGGYVPPGSSAAAVAKFGNLVKKKQKVTNEQKTTRMPDEQLVNLLFHAFEQYKYWTFKGLKDYSFLKDKLNEIAVLDKRGPYNNCYHLKPEYTRKSSQTSEAIAPAGLEAPGSSGDMIKVIQGIDSREWKHMGGNRRNHSNNGCPCILYDVDINISKLETSLDDHQLNTDHELIVQRVSNLIAGTFQVSLRYEESILLIKSGVNNRVVRLILAFCIDITVYFGELLFLIEYIPTTAVGTIIFYLGLDMIQEALLDSWKIFNKLEYLNIIATMGAMTFIGFGVIRTTFSGNSDRSSQLKELKKILIDCEKKGYPIRSFILNMLYVTGFNINSIHVLESIQKHLQHQKFCDEANEALEWCENLLFGTYYANHRLLYNDNQLVGVQHQTISSLLIDEYFCSNHVEDAGKIVFKNKIGLESKNKLVNILMKAFKGITNEKEEFFNLLVPYFTKEEIQKDSQLWSKGDNPHCIYVVEQGELGTWIPAENNKKNVIERILPFTMVGELGFFTDNQRPTNLVTNTLCVLWKMDQASYLSMMKCNPVLGAIFMKLVIKLSVERLRSSNHYAFD